MFFQGPRRDVDAVLEGLRQPQWRFPPDVTDALVMRDEIASLRAKLDARDRELAKLKADHAEMVRRNAVLRTRHDLPMERVKALDSFIAERDDAKRELAEAMRIVYQLVHGGDHHEITAAMQDGLQWLARHATTNTPTPER